MGSVTPYRPRPRRDPRVRQLLWQGVASGLVGGLLAGVPLWLFLLLGGAPLAQDRTHAVLTLAAGGAFGACAVCAWVWGRWGLPLVAGDALEAAGGRIAGVVARLAPAEDPGDNASAQSTGVAVVRGALAAPAGIPVMLMLLIGGRVRRLAPIPLGFMLVLGTVFWLLVLTAGWQWAVLAAPAAAPTAPTPTPAERARMARRSAELDSSLQLAVAKAKRAKNAGDLPTATGILEQALRDARAQGRSVSHLQLHWFLGWLYADQGNLDGAMVMFQTVLGLAEPGSRPYLEAEAALQRLAKRSAMRTTGPEPSSRILAEDAARNIAPAR